MTIYLLRLYYTVTEEIHNEDFCNDDDFDQSDYEFEMFRITEHLEYEDIPLPEQLINHELGNVNLFDIGNIRDERNFTKIYCKKGMIVEPDTIHSRTFEITKAEIIEQYDIMEEYILTK
jgi:hypothetical protein